MSRSDKTRTELLQENDQLRRRLKQKNDKINAYKAMVKLLEKSLEHRKGQKDGDRQKER